MRRHTGVGEAFFPVALVAALVLGALPCQAAPGEAPRGAPPEAQREAIKLTRQASALHNLGKYQEAVELFRKAVRLAPDLPGAWRNMGLAHEGLKQWKDAIQAYERYLELAGTSGRYSLQVMARVNECLKHLGQAPKVFGVLGAPGYIELSVSEEGATIMLNGLTRGSSPVRPLRVQPGLHVVEISKLGYLRHTQSVGVRAGQRIGLSVELQKDPSYVPPRRLEGIKHVRAGDEAYLQVQSQAEGIAVLVDGKALSQNEEGWWVLPKPTGIHVVEVRAAGRLPWRAQVELTRGIRKTLNPILPIVETKRRYALWGWVSLGLAAVLAGTGGVFGALENKTYEKVRDRRAETRDDLKDIADRGRLYRGVALGLYAAAGVALTSSITLFVFERRGEHPRGRPLPLVVAPVEAGTGLAVSFSTEVDF